MSLVALVFWKKHLEEWAHQEFDSPFAKCLSLVEEVLSSLAQCAPSQGVLFFGCSAKEENPPCDQILLWNKKVAEL